jgi:small subunit ribosomal protein S20
MPIIGWRAATFHSHHARKSYCHMANIKSQKKRNRQNLVHNARNRAVRSELRTRIGIAVAAAEASDENAAELARTAQRQIDIAVSKGLLKKNTAARRKSAIARKVNQASK